MTLAPLAALALAIAPPFRAEQDDVRRGNALVARGDAAAALPHYARAEREAGDRPELAYDRAVAAFRLGRLVEAQDGFARAAARADAPLASRAAHDLGTARAAAGDEDGAAAAFRDALRKDPANEDARWDLEVLLRRRAARATAPPAVGAAPEPAAGGAKGRGAPPGADSPPPPARGAGAARNADTPARDRARAERLLDALRAREKAMPAVPAEPRRARAKDW